MKFKSYASTLLSVAMAFHLTACSQDEAATPAPSSDKPAASAPAPEKVQHTERYIVGVDVTYPPYTTRDAKGQAAGFEVEILQAIADNQKFSIDLLPAPRNSLYPDLLNGKYQILAASLKPTPERAEKSDFTDSFAKSHYTILSRSNKVVKSGIALSGLSVAVQDATNSHQKLNEVGANSQVYPTFFEAFKAFLNGKADYVVGDSVVLGYYLTQHAGDKVNEFVFTPFDDTPDTHIAFAVNKGNTALLEKMNAGMKNIKQNGQYDEIYNKYFKDKSASTNQP